MLEGEQDINHKSDKNCKTPITLELNFNSRSFLIEPFCATKCFDAFVALDEREGLLLLIQLLQIVSRQILRI